MELVVDECKYYIDMKAWIASSTFYECLQRGIRDIATIQSLIDERLKQWVDV